MLRKSSINKSSRFIDVKVLQKLVVEIDEQHEELCLGGSFSGNDENRLRLKSLNNLEIVQQIEAEAGSGQATGKRVHKPIWFVQE